MIPRYEGKTTEQGGRNLGSLEITLKQKNIRHIIRLIRDSAYSDKELAPLREYSTNAFDAHLEYGNPEVPIRVTLPTLLEPQLKIRDFGPGLTRQEMEDIYLSVGESTKRESDLSTGSMGLGSKSGYAYGDSFIVVCWKNGRNSAYNLVLDDSQSSGCRCDILFDRECDINEHGVEIIIPVKEQDIRIFPQKALSFFKYWRVFPDIVNLDEDEKNRVLSEFNKPSILSGDGWVIKPKVDRWGNSQSAAVMGNIPYPIDWYILREKMTFKDTQERVIFEFLMSNNVIFNIPNGELDFSVSRETMQYTDRTVAALSTKVRQVIDSIQTIVVNQIKKANNIWEAKLIWKSIFSNSTTRRSSDDEDDLIDDTGFSGELYRLAEFFKDKLEWNGIKINNYSFNDICHWDRSTGRKEYSGGHSQLMEVFNLIGNVVKSCKSSAKKYRGISPNKKVLVVVNDLYKNNGGRIACKYILQHANPNNVTRIYFLNFLDPAVKDAFFSHYNFDTVPCLMLSDWLNKAKTFNKMNRATRSGGASTSGQGSRGPRETHYIDVDGNSKVNRYYSRRRQPDLWSSGLIDVQDEEGYYVERNSQSYDKNEVRVNGQSISIGQLAEVLHTISETFDLDVNRVYGFSTKTLTSKWFIEAVEDEQWKTIDSLIKNDIVPNIPDELKRVANFIKAIEVDNHYLGFAILKKFKNKIDDVDSPINKMIEAFDNIKNDYKKYGPIINSLSTLGVVVPTDESDVDYKKIIDDVYEQYPILWKLDNLYSWKADSLNTFYDICQDKTIKVIIDYINLVDRSKVNDNTAIDVNEEMIAA